VTEFVDLLIQRKKKDEKYFTNYMKYAKVIKNVSTKSLEGARVLVFGSVIKGNWVPNKSDIDVLIISNKVLKSGVWQSELKLNMLQEIGDITAPFDIHFATPEIYNSWFKNFIKNDFIEV
jgi:uncharacterized protein